MPNPQSKSYAEVFEKNVVFLGKATVNITNGIVPFIVSAGQQTLAAGGGAVTLTEYYTAGASDAGGDAWTMADATKAGHLKKVQLVTDGGGDATLTPTTLNGGTTVTFADVGDFAIFMWDDSGWDVLELGNAADGTTAPVLA